MLKTFFYFLILLCTAPIAQTPTDSEWDKLAKESDLVLIGVVNNVAWIEQQDMNYPATTKSFPNEDQLVKLRRPSEFVVGRSVQIKVQELIKKNGKVKVGDEINIFLPDRISLEGMPSLNEKGRYVIFLSRMKDDKKELNNTVVKQPGSLSAQGVNFDQRSHYTVIGDQSGAVQVTSENSRLVEKLKASVRRRQ